MCGRFVVASSPDILADRFKVDEVALDEHAPDYNVTPRAMVPIVRERPARDDREQARVLSLVRWGLVPSWAKDPKLGDRLINARSETVATTNSYQAAFRKRRCIIPADAFYEWTSKDKLTAEEKRQKTPRQPYLVHRRDGEPMAFAGLWEIWRDQAIAGPRCTRRVASHVHDHHDARQRPAGADPRPHAGDAGGAHLGRRGSTRRTSMSDALEALLVPAPDDWLEVYPVEHAGQQARQQRRGPDRTCRSLIPESRFQDRASTR